MSVHTNSPELKDKSVYGVVAEFDSPEDLVAAGRESITNTDTRSWMRLHLSRFTESTMLSAFPARFSATSCSAAACSGW